MKKLSWVILTTVTLVVGVAFAIGFWGHAYAKQQSTRNGPAKLKTLTIRWQRLVGNTGQTCDRCGSTQEEVRKAHALLHKSLSVLGINVVLEEKTLDKATAAKRIAESNRIWVGGKPLESWLGANTGASECTSCGSLCGGNVDCRTVIVGGNAYESIPSALIVKAGLLAGAEMVSPKAAQPRYGGLPLSGVQTITDGTSGSGGCK